MLKKCQTLKELLGEDEKGRTGEMIRTAPQDARKPDRRAGYLPATSFLPRKLPMESQEGKCLAQPQLRQSASNTGLLLAARKSPPRACNLPISISYMMTPSDHQSQSLLYPVCMNTSGAM